MLIGSPTELDPRLGAAQLTLNLAEALRRAGTEVEIWSPPRGIRRLPWPFQTRARRSAFARAAARSGAELVEAASWMIGPRLREPKRRLIVRSVQPDLTYLDSERAARPRSPLRRFWSAMHERDLRRLIVAGWNTADRILVLGSRSTRELGASHARLTPKLRAYFVAPGAEDRKRLREVAGARPKERPALGDAKWLWIGRWAEHKGLEELRSFVVRLLADCPSAHVTIAGCGSGAAESFDSAARGGGRLRFIESFARAELPALLADHDVGLFTSKIEGWGLSIQEMLESGMPVFATAQGAVEDLVRWFPNQLAAFPPHLDAALPEPESESRFAEYANEFSWEAIAERYLEAISA